MGLGAIGVGLSACGHEAEAAERFPVAMSDAAWRQNLGPAAYAVLRREGTERPYSSPLNGEHRSGVFTIDGTAFRFHVSYHRHRSDEESRVPWDTYLTRRILWIGLADEPCPFP